MPEPVGFENPTRPAGSPYVPTLVGRADEALAAAPDDLVLAGFSGYPMWIIGTPWRKEDCNCNCEALLEIRISEHWDMK